MSVLLQGEFDTGLAETIPRKDPRNMNMIGSSTTRFQALLKPQFDNEVAPPLKLKFDYTNWRGEDHTYVVVVEKVEHGPFQPEGIDNRPDAEKRWALHGNVVTRDGSPRQSAEAKERGEAASDVRRTFILADIRSPEWVDA